MLGGGNIKIHYLGYNERCDEIMETESSRIRDINTSSQGPGQGQYQRSSSASKHFLDLDLDLSDKHHLPIASKRTVAWNAPEVALSYQHDENICSEVAVINEPKEADSNINEPVTTLQSQRRKYIVGEKLEVLDMKSMKWRKTIVSQVQTC